MNMNIFNLCEAMAVVALCGLTAIGIGYLFNKPPVIETVIMGWAMITLIEIKNRHYYK